MNLSQGVNTVLPDGGIEEALKIAQKEKRQLRVKFGIDPTGSELTLGHSVVLRKLRQFQDAGHQAVLIIGDFTAQLGDPTGRSSTRVVLTQAQVAANAKTYLAQALTVLSEENLEVHFNSKWLTEMKLPDMLELASLMTVAQLSSRNDFANRLESNQPVALSEFFYPLLQGLDSVEIKADIELGGSDQLFNLMVGRELQKAKGQRPQTVITMPILEGLDGVQKMSKSLGNFVSLTEPADEQFGKLMSMPDSMILRYALLCSPMSEEKINEVTRLVETGGVNAGKAKRKVAKSIVEAFHPGESENAEAAFNKLFVTKDNPMDAPEFETVEGAPLTEVMVQAQLAPSRSEARRLITGGAVKLDGIKINDPRLILNDFSRKLLQVGKRKAVKLLEKETVQEF